jgi:hypothetical protein
LISLSLRPTAHPLNFQLQWVRSSTWSYPSFNLAIGRSPGFGSTSCDLFAHFGLAFASTTPHGLILPHNVTRRPIMQKVRGHPLPEGHRAPTVCKRTVSDSISLPSRGSFHLSLTVLVHYRSPGSIQPWKMILPDSGRVPRAPPYSGVFRRDE